MTTVARHGTVAAVPVTHRLLPCVTALVLILGGCSDDASPERGALATTATTRADTVTGVVVIGDFGGGPAQGEVAAAMERWSQDHRVDALVTTGDNVYEQGEPEKFAAYLREPYEDLLDGAPMWATLGNHDVQGGYGDQQLAFLGLPALPYEKTLPGVEFYFLDGNRPDDDQAEWLDARLSEPGARFRVAVFHQPAYSCSTHGNTAGVVEQWVPVFERNGIDLVLAGHDHLYEHFVSGAGVDYVVTGGGGKSIYPFKEPCEPGARHVAQAEEFHFVSVEVEGDVMTVAAVASDDGRVIEEFTIRG